MKTTIFFAILFYVITLPAFGALTPEDLNEIRLIVKEEVKTEVTALKQELKTEIVDSEKRMKEHVDIKVDSVDDKLTFLSYLVYALIALIVGAIAIPQLIMAWQSARERSLERKVEMLIQEVETLKQQRIVNP